MQLRLAPRRRASRPQAILVVFLLGLSPSFWSGSDVAAAQPNKSQQNVRERQKAERLHLGMLELRRLERQGNRVQAIRFGEELLQEFPGERRIEDALINLYRVERRDKKLIELLSARIERDPDDVATARELGAHLLARKQQSEALKMMQRVIAANPRDEGRYRAAAVLFRSHRQIDIAIKIYRQGREAIGREILFAAELAQLEESRGDYGAAIGEYLLLVMDPDRRSSARRKIIKLFERADNPRMVLEQIDELRSKHPKSSPVQDIAATAYLHNGQFEEAFKAIKTADRYADDQGEHLLEFGRLALKTEEDQPIDLARAQIGVEALKRLPKAHPRSNLIPEASRLLAEGLVSVARQVNDAMTSRGLLEEAVESLETSLEEPGFVNLRRDAMALKAMILFEDLEKYPDALGSFDELIAFLRQRNESFHMPQVQKGLVLAAMGNMQTAREVLQEVVDTGTEEGEVSGEEETPRDPHHAKRKPATPESIGRSRARYHLAELDLSEGKFEAALESFAALAEEAPEDRLANDCLDLALTINEATFDPPEAMQHFSTYRLALMQRDPNRARTELEALVQDHANSTLHPLALFELARNLDESGKYEVALQQYEKVVEVHAEHRLAPRALEAIGDVYLEKLGQPEKAIENYERILLDHPDDLFLDGVRRKLLNARRAVKGEDDATP